MSTAPRSLADALRAASDDGLAALLQARPDLLTPVPTDLTQLAIRATTGTSVARAMDRLDRWTLQVLEAACVPPEPFTAAELTALLGVHADDVQRAVDALVGLALLWSDAPAPDPDDDSPAPAPTPDATGLHVVTFARDMVGPLPGELGPPLAVALTSLPPTRVHALVDDLGLPSEPDAAGAVAAVTAMLADPDDLATLLAPAPAAAREVLEQLTWGTPLGTLPNADRAVRAATAASAIDWLLARGLLVAVDRTTVVLPREVSLALRGGRVLADPQPVAPDLPATASRDPALVDRSAGQQAFTAVRTVTDLLEAWGVEPPPALRAGGLGVRELRRLATALDVEEWAAALLAETAYAAGLLGPSDDLAPGWLPTPAYDAWRLRDTATQWTTLVQAWLATTRVAGLVGARDDRDKALAALGPDLDRTLAPEVRRGSLAALAGLAPGAVGSPEAVEALLQWQRPRRPTGLRADLVRWTLREADLLGVTGLGALAGPARLLLADGVTAAAVAGAATAAAEALAPLLPAPLDHVLLQADLTAVAPGPLEADLAHALALMADVESRGGATVYRFSDASVRRALDAGRTAVDLHALLAAHSRTPVPQPLSYLVDDVARRHGRIRVGAAACYVRSDDEATLGALLAERRAAELRLRRLAPTVLAAQAPPEVVLDRLRAMGYAPAAEGPEGDVLVRRPDARRAPAGHRPPRVVAEPAVPGERLVTAAVRALRAGERASRAPRGRVVAGMAGPATLPRTAAAETLAVLRDAVESGRPVWIGYVDGHGGVTERVVDPVRVDGGYLTAYDHRYAEVHTFAVHRITGVAELDAEPA